MRRVRSSRALFVLLATAAAAAAVALNLLLLGSASAGNDPVGQLRPRTGATTSTHRTGGARLDGAADDRAHRRARRRGRLAR